jgi:hypothetical protein
VDPLGNVALSISNEAAEACIPRPCPSETVSFEGADREAEELRRGLLSKKANHFAQPLCLRSVVELDAVKFAR